MKKVKKCFYLNVRSDQFLNSFHIKLKELGSDHVLPRLSEWARGDQAMVLKNFCASIGITPIKFHDLRATFITNMLAQGVPLVKVMAVVGHKQMKTTVMYLRLAGEPMLWGTQLLKT